MSENSRYIDRVLTSSELRAKLESGKTLHVKYGIDITGSSLHLGHAVNLWLMRAFQERGHIVDLVLGDFTTIVGDPTDKLNSRSGVDCLEETMESYIQQIGKILLTGPSHLRILRNSEWYSKMNTTDLIKLTSMVTHARVIERDMFRKRMEQSKEIILSELLYPVLQGYDSVVLNSDLTVVGSDQHFNEDMARHLQTKHNQTPQTIILTVITPGLGQSSAKQSKSMGNFIAIDLSPRDMFAKVMKLEDKLIIEYFYVYTTVPTSQVEEIRYQLELGGNPRDAKLKLAQEITCRYHGNTVAAEELDFFVQTFSNRNPNVKSIKCVIGGHISVNDFIMERLGDIYGQSGLLRVADAGGVQVNGEKITSTDLRSRFLSQGDLLRIGKKNMFYIEIN